MNRGGRNRSTADRKGHKGEGLAAFYLQCKGWRVLARRQRVGQGRGVGEVDLVVRRGRTVAFVEVKWRSDVRSLDQALDEQRLRRVARAAQAMVHRFARPDDVTRIDAILLAPWHWPRHITHVWQP
ncbi:YraN family protein [Novosphingobium nitrogenifigens]|uniref:YraN family protein n=1 Tax=Novosphingobium nitrogenifigens TaxID=378548 RepID=UPI000374A62D|nr:YraN family protein [Novosphingobium nitrogenifigens]